MSSKKYSNSKYKTIKNGSYLLMMLLVVLIVGILIIFWSIKRPFCANSLSCKESLSLNIENNSEGIFNGQKIKVPNINLSEDDSQSKVLGEESFVGEKHIYVDLSTQTLTAYQDNMLFMTAIISSGKWFETPTGEFTIWKKIRATKMSGGEGADYYYLPNVPYVMFYSNDKVAASRGFSFHGAYWHNNFGHAMSHGCVNMRTIDAQKLYDWVGEDSSSTKVSIYGEAK